MMRQCAYCSYQSRYTSHLKRHERHHTGDKPFACDSCTYRTTNKTDLKRHVRHVHTKERNFTCAQCDYAAPTRVQVNRHTKRRHRDPLRDERPLQCSFPGCKYTAFEHHEIIRHQSIHTKSFKCRVLNCHLVFGTLPERARHENDFHARSLGQTFVKKKEEWFIRLLTSLDEGFDREVYINHSGCIANETWSRLDFVLHRPTFLIICSIDEFQHKDREVSCEIARMSKICLSISVAPLGNNALGGNRRILWFRINPDYFHVHGHAMRVDRRQREFIIAECLKNAERLLGQAELSLYYLFYDCFDRGDGKLLPEVTCSPEYDKHWREIVKACIINKESFDSALDQSLTRDVQSLEYHCQENNTTSCCVPPLQSTPPVDAW